MKAKKSPFSRHSLRWAIAAATLAAIAVIGTVTSLALRADIPVIQTGGPIAESQKELLVWTLLLMLIVVIPVFLLTAGIAWRYRDTAQKKASYQPEWDHHKGLEIVWWGIPFIIVAVISFLIYESSHRLDPYRPLATGREPITIQVVALQWKWLFIYPQASIATVNHFTVPTDTPIEFHISADAPMNSFWIPELGGQVYAMNGMTTKLHLQADREGQYRGMSANISGEKYAAMNFAVDAVEPPAFEHWLHSQSQQSSHLSSSAYELLRQPEVSDRLTYGRVEAGLYDSIVMRYMGSDDSHQQSDTAKTQRSHTEGDEH